MSPYFFAYLAIIIACVALTPLVHFWLHGYRADTFADYNTAVLNQVAGVVIHKKNEAYPFKDFYSTGNVDFSEFNLVNNYLSLADIECITSDRSLNTCGSLQVNDVSIPRKLDNARFSRFVCTNQEYGLLDTGNNMYKVRILNYDYTFHRTCINLVINKAETVVGPRVLLSIKNDMAAQLLVLLRPQFLTTNMSYLYKVVYANDPLYYGSSVNSPRSYTSTAAGLNLLLEKVEDASVYATKFLIGLEDIHRYEDLTKDTKCSDVKTAVVEYVEQEQFVQYIAPPESYPVAMTVYHHRLVGKMPAMSINLTNSLALHFEIDLANTDKFKTDTVMFHMRRSAAGKPDVCKAMEVKLRNDAIKCVNINLGVSLTYTFEFPTESKTFRMILVYALDLIIVCAFYTRSNGVGAFKYAMYDTSVISSWSLADISEATHKYGCGLPPAAEPATSSCIPTFYDMLTSLQII